MSKYVTINIYMSKERIYQENPQNILKKKGQEHMEKIKEFETYVKFLISLFEIIEFKYSCTTIKLGKLLSVVAFLDAMKNEAINPIFGDSVKIYEYKNCGTQILRLQEIGDLFTNYSIYTIENASITQDEEVKITNKVNEHLENKCNFELIKDVFLVFGAKTPGELGRLITDFLNIKDSNLYCNSEKNLPRHVNLAYIGQNSQTFEHSNLYKLYADHITKQK